MRQPRSNWFIWGANASHAPAWVAQGRTRRHCVQSQCTLEDGVVAKALDGVEVAFAHAQEGEVALENLAVGHPRAYGELQIDKGVDVNALEVFTDKGKACMGTEVAGKLFDNKGGHVWVHLRGDQYTPSKLLISMVKSTYFYF